MKGPAGVLSLFSLLRSHTSFKDGFIISLYSKGNADGLLELKPGSRLQDPRALVAPSHERGLARAHTETQLYSQRAAPAHYAVIHQCDIVRGCLKSR